MSGVVAGQSRPMPREFPAADRVQVARALQLARRMYLQRRTDLRRLIASGLGPERSKEVADYFVQEYEAKLMGLAPENGVRDGRRSAHRLQDGTVGQFLEQNRIHPAVVIETEINQFVIFWEGPTSMSLAGSKPAFCFIRFCTRWERISATGSLSDS